MLDQWVDIAAIVGGVTAVAVLFYTAIQVRQNTLISRGQLWLELEKMFTTHDPVHIALRPGGKWSGPNSGPETVEEWAQLEDYMGLFEHCEIMLERKLIDWDTFGDIFAYRLHNIADNTRIVDAKLIQERRSWKRFLRLLQRLDIEVVGTTA